MHKVKIKNFFIGKQEPLCIIAGPCVIEDEEHTHLMAEALKKMFQKTSINLIFKASYDKANRSSITSFRGPGLEKGLLILKKIKTSFDLPIISDVHTPQEVKKASKICDILQIPAFLSRQTDLLKASAQTQKPIHIKKGQFMSAYDMKNVVDKILYFNNKNILLTDRGTSFGYNHLISDITSIPIMQELGFPSGIDITHSLQKPSFLGKISGGQRRFAPHLAKAAIAAGANYLFLETHNDPKNAKCDKETVLSLQTLESLLPKLEELYNTVQKFYV